MTIINGTLFPRENALKTTEYSLIQRKQEERKEWVDVIRAVAMILVVYGHQSSGWLEYFVFTSPIKIPLFFAITGYVFNDSNGDFKAFMRKLWRTLIVPWLVIASLPYIAASPFKGFSFLKENLIAVLTGENYWYMPCCVIAEIIWFWILKYSKTVWKAGLITIALFVAGVLLHKNNLMSMFMLNVALTVQGFLLLGRLFRVYEIEIAEKVFQKKALVVWLIIYIILGLSTLFYYPGQCIDVHQCRYYNILVSGAMIVIGIYSLASFTSNCIGHFPKWLIMIGQNTLVIYLLHNYLIKIFRHCLVLIHIPISYFSNVILTVVVCLAGMLISRMIKSVLPELMGKRRV